MPAPDSAPPMIRTDPTNAFAHHTMRVRVPAILRQVRDLNPDYPPAIHRALEALAQGMEGNAPIPPLDLPAPDYEGWAAAHAAHAGDTWLGTDWFYAENFAYRLVIQAVRWWETGRDPFAPVKHEEERGDALWQLVERSWPPARSPQERLHALLHDALWANRIDLSYATAAQHGLAVDQEDLLVDDSAQAVQRLLRAPGPVHLVADNAGRELAMDLLLAAALLDGVAEQVFVHLKLHPTFVSDATPADLLRFLDRMQSADLGRRLRAALDAGRLRLAPDLFWNSSALLWDMPPRLARLFSGARLVIIKGDANYRRLVGDALWPPETPFSAVVAYFPAPLLALRSLKSDPIVGLPPGLAPRLDALDPHWRTNGQRGVLQAAL